MKYTYKYKNTAYEIWKLSMYHIYGSLAGVCNGIFTVALILLTVVKWGQINQILRILFVAFCLWFPVMQPFIIYQKCKRQAAGIKDDVEISFENDGIHTKLLAQQDTITWDKIKKVSKKPGMIIVFSDTTHGYVLTKRIVGNDMEELYNFLISKMPNKK